MAEAKESQFKITMNCRCKILLLVVRFFFSDLNLKIWSPRSIEGAASKHPYQQLSFLQKHSQHFCNVLPHRFLQRFSTILCLNTLVQKISLLVFKLSTLVCQPSLNFAVNLRKKKNDLKRSILSKQQQGMQQRLRGRRISNMHSGYGAAVGQTHEQRLRGRRWSSTCS